MNCYESFSFPKQYVEISYDYTSSPHYLFISIQTRLNSFIYGYKSKRTFINYHLKKIDGQCNTSLIFTTLGKDFIIFDLNIVIYLFYPEDELTEISYSFFPDFIPDNYELVDKYIRFSIRVPVLNIIKDYTLTYITSFMDVKSFLNSFSNKNTEICIINNNIDALVLYYLNKTISSGLMTGLEIEVFENSRSIHLYNFLAFDYYINETSYKEKIILIWDQPPTSKIRIRPIYRKFNDEYQIYAIRELKFSNIKLEDINDQYINMHRKNVLFLLKFTIEKVTCSDNNELKVYKYNNTNFFSYGYIFPEIAYKITKRVIQFRYSENPCEENLE